MTVPSRPHGLADTTASGNQIAFVAICCAIVSMYGGGFACIPACLADIFGTQFVGAIHGWLLTAWSTAGILGPVIVNYLREFQLSAGVPSAQVYDFTMFILAARLGLGLIANLSVRPLGETWFMSEGEVAALQAKSASSMSTDRTGSLGIGRGGPDTKVTLPWCAVGITILLAVWNTFLSTASLFR